MCQLFFFTLSSIYSSSFNVFPVYLYIFCIWTVKFGYQECHFSFCRIWKKNSSPFSSTSSSPACVSQRTNFRHRWVLFSLCHWPDMHCICETNHFLYTERCQQHTTAVCGQVAGRSDWICPHQWLQELSALIQACMKAEEDWVWKMIIDSWGN